MDEFTQHYLLCQSTRPTVPDSAIGNIAFTPGPPIIREPLTITDIEHAVSYPSPDIFAAFSALPRVQQVTPQRVLRWTLADRWIQLEFAGTSDEEWNGTEISCLCTFADIVWMWLAVSRTHRSVLVQDAHGRLFTPRSFLHTFALPQLAKAFSSDNQQTQERAEKEMKVYRLVGHDALR